MSPGNPSHTPGPGGRPRRGRAPRAPAATPAAADGNDPAQGGRLIVVARRVSPTRERVEQIRASDLHFVATYHLRLGRSPAAHRYDPGCETIRREEAG